MQQIANSAEYSYCKTRSNNFKQCQEMVDYLPFYRSICRRSSQLLASLEVFDQSLVLFWDVFFFKLPTLLLPACRQRSFSVWSIATSWTEYLATCNLYRLDFQWSPVMQTWSVSCTTKRLLTWFICRITGRQSKQLDGKECMLSNKITNKLNLRGRRVFCEKSEHLVQRKGTTLKLLKDIS